MVVAARNLLCLCVLLCAGAAFAQAGTSACERSGACAASPAAPGGALPGPDEGAAREARRAFERGLSALRAERWAEAEAELRASLRLVPRASSSYNLAFVLFKQGKLRESASLLRALMDATGDRADGEYSGYAGELLPRVLAESSTLQLRLEPASALLSIDGVALAGASAERSVVLDPGPHRIEVSAPGFVPARIEAALPAQASSVRSIALQRAPAAPPPVEAGARGRGRRGRAVLYAIGPWVAMGLGAALLASSAVTASLAKRADRAFVERCPTLRDCSPALKQQRAQALQLGRATDVLIGSGIALGLGGVSFRLLAPKLSLRPAERAWSISVGARF